MSTMEQTYTTPEGFELYRRLLLPDARSFAEVLTAERSWNFATMNHKNGVRQAETPEEIKLLGLSRVVSRFCAVRNLPGRSHLQVTPTAATLALLEGDEFSFFDRIGFEVIYHESNDRCLVTASASGIIASRWLAYIDAESVPTFEEAES